MKLNKQVIIILVLLSLLISSIGAAAYFYIKNKKTAMDNSKLVTIYVAAKDIKKGSLINEEMLKQTTVAKKFILTKPLLQKEIVGKFAKETIYENDIFRKEKIVNRFEPEETSLIAPFEYNSYNIAFKLFRNPNYSLKKNDIIDIISVYENKREDGSIIVSDPYKVQIIADNVKVLGFLRDGEETDKTIVEQVVTKTVKKKEIKEKIKVKADELLLDITSNVLLKLTDDYNKGRQIWMVKTKVIKKKPVEIEELAVKKPSKKTKSVYKEYPYRIYTPKERTDTLTATIHYADNDEASIKKMKSIKLKKIQECKEKEKFIVGTSKYIHFRSGPSVGYKIKRTIYKNIIIPYAEKVNDSWYKTCDDYFINTREVEELTKEQVEEKLIQKYPLKKVTKKTEAKMIPAAEEVSLDSSLCKKQNKFLIGRTDIVHLRRGPSLEHRITNIFNKGDKIAYDRKINDSWYLTCDGKYVNSYEVELDK
eukprot:Anaeramoba_ignava/a217917_168.p2 GENE.a217917_168~~a217917_168.p2  ORF type:complete len:479 (+),score=3.49 a217917_168:1775-3211(+)